VSADWNDQAAKLRKMMRQTRRRARIITLTSGKGGVGKTVAAINLGICLAAGGKRVLLVDADLGLANVDVLLNLQSTYNLAHVIAGQVTVDQAIADGPAGLQILTGGSGLTRLADLSEFERRNLMDLLSDLHELFDVIIFDTSAGISRNVMTFVDAADLVLVVATPEPASIADAYAVIKTAAGNQAQGHLSVLMNMVCSKHEARLCQQRISHVAKRFLGAVVYNAGYVLRDDHVAQAVRQRTPFVLQYPRCQASYCMISLVSKLTRISQPPAKETFLRRVANLFF